MKLRLLFRAAALALLFVFPLTVVGDTSINAGYKPPIKDYISIIDSIVSPYQTSKSDCNGSTSTSDSNTSSGDSSSSPCPKKKCNPENKCIEEQMALAFIPNDSALGSARLEYYVDGTNANLGGRQILGIYGIPYMEATATNLGTAMEYKIMQAGGAAITFKIDDNLPEGGSGYIVGLPKGGGAYSQARVSYVKADGTAANKATAAYLRQYRAGDGTVDYPVNGGRAARFITDAGRTFVFPYAGIEVIRDRTNGTLVVNGATTDGTLRQVKTVGGLLDIVPITDRNFEIRKYAATQVAAAKTAGLWTATGAPIEVMSFNAPANTQNTVTITNTRGSVIYTTTHTVVGDANGEVWTQDNVNGPFHYQRTLERKLLPGLGSGYRNEKWTATLLAAPGFSAASGGAPDFVKDNLTKDFFPLKSEKTFKSGLVRKSTAEYSKTSWDTEGTGSPSSQTMNTGTKADYSYNGSQQMTSRTFTQKVDATAGGAATLERKETYSYAPVAAGETLKVFDFRPRKTTTLLDGTVVAVSYASYATVGGSYVVVHETAATPASPYGDPANRRSEKRHFGGGANQGRLQQVRAEDGTLTTYDYAAQSGGGLLVTTTGPLNPAGSPVSGHSSRVTALKDVRGFATQTTTAHWTGAAWVDAERITSTYDNFGNLTSSIRTDLLSNQIRTLLEQTWDGPNLTRSVDESGVATSYEHFTGTTILQRTRREAVPAAGGGAAQPEIVTTFSGTFSMNSEQFPTWVHKTTTVAAVALTLATSTVMDEEGRALSETDANGYTTTHSYSADDTVETTTLPSGATQISTRTSDGQMLSTTGTGVIPQFYHHAARAGGGTVDTVFTALDNGPRWTRTETDAAGRSVKVSRPAMGGQVSEMSYIYDDGCPCGKPSLITTTGQPAKVMQYNDVGALIRQGISGDNTTLDINSASDRISETVRGIQFVGGQLWLVQTSAVYPTANDGQRKVTFTARSLLAGFLGNQTSVSEQTDIVGNTTRSVSELDRANRLQSSRTTAPGISDDPVSISLAGRTVSSHQPGSSGNVAYTYDDLGRQVAVHQPGHAHAETTAYVPNAHQVASVADAIGATTTFAYVPQGQPGAGQTQTVTAPDNGLVTTTYDLLGRILRVSGARTYPVGYTYDAYGQMAMMTTWQDFAGNAGAAVTTWTYEPATGLLLSKTDDAGKAITCTYDIAGRLKTRTWARGVTSTYNYDEIMGDLVGITYSDSTPAINYTRNRLGRILTATADKVSRSIYTYSPDTLLPLSETIQQDLDADGTFDFTRTLTRSQDALLRPAGYSLADGGSPAETAATYTYEPTATRLASIAFPASNTQSFAFTYAYDAARPHLITSVSGPVHTVSNTYEPDRDVLASKTNALLPIAPQLPGSVVSGYAYTVNNVGQRTNVATTGSAFSVATGWTWGYDLMGQVTSAIHATDATFTRGYTYDDIGNRKQASNGTAPTAQTTTYTANSLNQYSAITLPSNPANPVNPVYDHDGNMLSGATGPAAGKTFTWDAENRMTSVKDTAGNILVTYAYDHQGRRIRYNQASTATTTLWLYDGWNRIAEYQLPNSQPSTIILTRTHQWGNDLSGSTQGAGGAGGLLATIWHSAVNKQPTAIHYPLYDGNGNITEYLDSIGGLAAHFEYDTFGKTIVSNGPAANTFDYKFSSKPVDAVTGLYFYGLRDYLPIDARWMNKDPMGEASGANLFLFLRNSPCARVDFLGLNEVPTAPPAVPQEIPETPWPVPGIPGTDDGPPLPEPPSTSLSRSLLLGYALWEASQTFKKLEEEWDVDDCGRWCWRCQMRKSRLLAWPKRSPGMTFGHAAIQLPNLGTWGWTLGKHFHTDSPDSFAEFATTVWPGRISDDSGSPGFAIVREYRSCPSTVLALAECMIANSQLGYQLTNIKAPNCVGWACIVLKCANCPTPAACNKRRILPDALIPPQK